MRQLLRKMFFLCFLGCPLIASAQLIMGPAMECYVASGFVLSTDKQVIWWWSDSKNLKTWLISQDALTGRVMWRQSISAMPSEATTDALGGFYYIAGNNLVKAQLSTGGELWRTNLAAIAEQKYTPPPTLLERLEAKANQIRGNAQPMSLPVHRFSFGTPNYYYYSRPRLTGNNVLISREAMSGGGCVRNLCFRDWLILDQWNGGLIDGAPGWLVGVDMDDFLLGGESVFRVRNGAKKLIKEPVAELHDQFNAFGPALDLHSYRGLTLFAPDTRSEVPEARVLDKAGELRLKLKPTKNLTEDGWVVLERGFLHYSVSSGFYHPSEKIPYFWLEYFDDNGALQFTKAVYIGKSGYVRFVSTTMQGQVLLLNGDELLLISVPDLLKKATVPAVSSNELSGASVDYYSERRAKLVYRLEGGGAIEKLPIEGVKKKLVLSAFNADTLKPLWKTSETVLLKKRP